MRPGAQGWAGGRVLTAQWCALWVITSIPRAPLGPQDIWPRWMSSVAAFLLRVSLCLWSDSRLSSAPRQIENVDACLSFLDARGVNVQGLSAEGKADKPTCDSRPLPQFSSSLSEPVEAEDDETSRSVATVWKIYLPPVPPMLLRVAFHFFTAPNI